MNQSPASATEVQITLHNAEITGFLTAINERQRLVDLLNSNEEIIELTAAELRLRGADRGHRLDSIVVEKNDILMAVPHETSEQLRQRKIYRTGLMPAAAGTATAAFLLENRYVEGTVRLPSGLSATAQLNASHFGRFFALTQVTIWLPDGAQRHEPIVVLRRDAIDAIGRQAA